MVFSEMSSPAPTRTERPIRFGSRVDFFFGGGGGACSSSSVAVARDWLGGQIKGQEPGLSLVYPQGNPLHATEDSPLLQIGEHWISTGIAA